MTAKPLKPTVEERRAAAVERLLDDRVKQGLPRTVEDPATLRTIAGIVRAATKRDAS